MGDIDSSVALAALAHPVAAVFASSPAVAEEAAARHGVTFLYRDFRPGFRAGQAEARALGFYMQKYCGCVFSEEDRYQKQILKDLKEAEKHI